jgi:predicted outer membrane lipoprotein
MPAWTLANQGRASGIDVVGQRILFLAGLLVVIGLALVPASIAAAAVYFSMQWIVGVPLAGAMALLAILAILCVEIGIGVRWLGHRFDQFDLSAELRP